MQAAESKWRRTWMVLPVSLVLNTRFATSLPGSLGAEVAPAVGGGGGDGATR